MPIRDEPWPHGTPSLLSLAAPNPRAAAEPYANLLGWQLTPTDGGLVARVLDRPVAVFLHDADPQTDSWATHLVVDDIYVAAATARVAGATMSDPIDLGDEGRMARGVDPCGAAVGFWAPSDVRTTVGERGTLLWSELLVRDLDRAVDFYDIALDVSVQDPDPDEQGPSAGQPYATLTSRDGELVARIGVITDEFDTDVPAHWLGYLQVADVAGSVGIAPLFGFGVLLDPTDSDFGRIAVLQGPGGEAVGLLEL